LSFFLFNSDGLLGTEKGISPIFNTNIVSPDRVLRMLFVQNNPVVTAYYVVRQRVLGAK